MTTETKTKEQKKCQGKKQIAATRGEAAPADRGEAAPASRRTGGNMTAKTTGRTAAQEPGLSRAQARLRAAKLRTQACLLDAQMAYQMAMCGGKSADAIAIGDQLRLEADLIEMDAGL